MILQKSPVILQKSPMILQKSFTHKLIHVYTHTRTRTHIYSCWRWKRNWLKKKKSEKRRTENATGIPKSQISTHDLENHIVTNLNLKLIYSISIDSQ